MATDKSQSVLEIPFQVESIVPVDDPNGIGASWYRYVISQGTNLENAITGTKAGTLADVTVQLREMVERLNERFGKLPAKRN